MTEPQPPDRPKRRRDPEASRAAILEAAREVFSEHGYAGSTIREIARRAGVTHGLVMRHFGSKEQLLIAAQPGVRDLPAWLPGPTETLPERTARAFVAQSEHSEGDTTLLTLIRSAASGDATVLPLYAELDRQSSDAYREVLGDDADVYIDLLRALLIGVTFNRSIAKTGAIATLDEEQLIEYLTAALGAILAPVIGRD
jgi:Bacterial regulatory proteins, tetR family/Tetracyclin repressor-like, C-terminal domain